MKKKQVLFIIALTAAMLACMCSCTNARGTEEKTEIDPESTVIVQEEDIAPPAPETTEEDTGNGESEPAPSLAEEETEIHAASITGYSVERQDYSVHSEGRDFYMYYDLVTFQGNDPAISVVNQIILNNATEYEEMVKLCFSDLSDYLSDTYPYSAPHYFEPRELKSVYYDENYISAGWEIQWYAGGVHNECWESVNIDRETLSELSISDVLGEDAKAIIDRALEESIASNESGFEYDLESVTFFFDEGTIYIGFGSGSLAGISWYVLIKIPR